MEEGEAGAGSEAIGAGFLHGEGAGPDPETSAVITGAGAMAFATPRGAGPFEPQPCPSASLRGLRAYPRHFVARSDGRHLAARFGMRRGYRDPHVTAKIVEEPQQPLGRKTIQPTVDDQGDLRLVNTEQFDSLYLR